MKIFLDKYHSKKSTNDNKSVSIHLLGRNRLLPLDSIVSSINENNLYDSERINSNIVRLTCIINPICSNVLFNNITEIVKNEGSDDCKSLNFVELSEITNTKLLHKTVNNFKTELDAIRDTQLSSEKNGFIYHCGLDIFNNHILRSNTFKTVCKLSSSGATNQYFNTIEDYMRSVDGESISGYSDIYEGTATPDIKLHLYLSDDILSFKDCVASRLIDKNGWLGFINIGKFGTYNNDNSMYDIYNVINSKKSCDFIDMYPSRDLWYFTPKYNQHRQRLEKNWHYCLTYPSSQTTDVDFIRAKTNSLKITMFDDDFINSNGTSGMRIYSICKHGLSEGDVINLYNGDTVLLRNAIVSTIDNEYIFSIYTNGYKLSNNSIILSVDELRNGKFTNNSINYILHGDTYKFATIDGDISNTKFPILPNYKINLDKSSLDLSYKKVVSGEEVMYYVRIFSRLPNWKYSNIKPTKSELYKPNSDLIFKNQTINTEFENHMSKLAFAKNIYNDDISEIVFTDDIDISNLKDNLGRPLTDIYLTIIKNNQGYRKWYGITNTMSEVIENDNIKPITNESDIEYSHCFGKLNCAFKLSKESLWDDNIKNLLSINRIDKKLGLPNLNNITNLPIDIDEIQYNKLNDYNGDVLFYGDLCCYSTKLLDEYVIQPINFRFNTAQRELIDTDKSYETFRSIYYDEITQDDYDNISNSKFEITTYDINNVCQRKEGYVYEPHYKIPIRTFSDTISIQKPYYISIKDINDSLDEIYTLSKHNFNLYDKFIIRIINNETNKTDYIYCEVTEIIDYRRFKFKTIDEVTLDRDTIMKYGKIVKGGDDIPEYATLSTDGSCYYMWREVIPNGYDSENKVETYPFTNGALYVNKHINLFVKRQDPNGYGGLQSNTYPYDKDSNILNKTEENNYYQEEDIQC